MDLKQETINYIKNIGKVMNEDEDIKIDDLINTEDVYNDYYAIVAKANTIGTLAKNDNRFTTITKKYLKVLKQATDDISETFGAPIKDNVINISELFKQALEDRQLSIYGDIAVDSWSGELMKPIQKKLHFLRKNMKTYIITPEFDKDIFRVSIKENDKFINLGTILINPKNANIGFKVPHDYAPYADKNKNYIVKDNLQKYIDVMEKIKNLPKY